MFFFSSIDVFQISQLLLSNLNLIKSLLIFQEVEEWISGAGDAGFVFVSMGSSVRTSSMPLSAHRLFVDALGRLPHRVLWKQDAEQNMTDIPSNVRLYKWLPQQDLLGELRVYLLLKKKLMILDLYLGS
jgi:UDP:flavonoid glycosyltransferase YjiC (YdhE family)